MVPMRPDCWSPVVGLLPGIRSSLGSCYKRGTVKIDKRHIDQPEPRWQALLAFVAVAAIYGALALAAWRLLVRAPGTACGCLGASDTPVTATHVVVNVAAALVAGLAAATPSPFSAVESGVWSRVAFVVLVGCCAWLVTSVLDALPALNAVAREGGSR